MTQGERCNKRRCIEHTCKGKAQIYFKLDIRSVTKTGYVHNVLNFVTLISFKAQMAFNGDRSITLKVNGETNIPLMILH